MLRKKISSGKLKKYERNKKKRKKCEREEGRDNSCPLSCVVTFCASDGVNQSALRSRDIITPNAYLLHDKYVTGTQCSLPFFASMPVCSVLSSHLRRGQPKRTVLWAQPCRWCERLWNIKSHTHIYVTWHTYTRIILNVHTRRTGCEIPQTIVMDHCINIQRYKKKIHS